MNAAAPTQVRIETPEYAGWKKYSPGTKVSLDYRLLMERRVAHL